jgi:hypothetical protein
MANQTCILGLELISVLAHRLGGEKKESYLRTPSSPTPYPIEEPGFILRSRMAIDLLPVPALNSRTGSVVWGPVTLG